MPLLLRTLLLLAFGFTTALRAADPQLTSWFTANSGLYARIYQTDTARTNGTTLTTWANPSATLSQSIPAYRGVQEISYSTNWIYIRSTGLGQHIMGPWYDNAVRSTLFVNSPTNQKALYSIPRTSTLTNPPTTKTATFGSVDVIGYFVDGVAMFDALDGFVWTGSTEGNGNGQWRRGAYPNEYITFDTANTHQQNTGTYHNHANPIALRYLLGDHIDQNPVTKLYSESTNAVTKHSPIIGWVRDGLPMYGPYGYASPSNSASGIRRMVSGFTLRDGTKGSDNLTIAASRSPLPAWTLRGNGNTTQTGPAVSTTYPLGRYLQDYSYLGDLTNSLTSQKYQLGTDFDLNEWNVRYCVTPEFPGGTWAYFICIDSNGTPIAPWNIGQYFFGTPTGNKVTSITETVVTNFSGGPNATLSLSAPKVSGGNVTLVWSATEGGTYRVENTTNFTAWTTNTTNATASGNSGSYTNSGAGGYKFFKVARTALANFDPVSGSSTNNGGGGTQTITMVPASGTHGTSFSVTATISASATPAVPPQSGAPVASFTVGTNVVTGAAYSYSGGQGIVTGTLPLGVATGAQTVTITFSPPMGQPQGPSYVQTNGFTIN